MHLTKALAALSAGSLLLIGHSTLAHAQDDPYTDDNRATTQAQTEDDRASESSEDTWSTDSDMQARTQATETEGDDADSWSTSDDSMTAQSDTASDEWSTSDDTTSDDMTAQSDDSWSTDSETTADVDVDSDTSVESQSTMDTYAQTEDDEFSADVDVDSDASVAATDDEFDVDVDADTDSTVAATGDDDFDVDADVNADAASGSTAAMGGDANLQEQVASIDVEVNVDEQKIQELAQIHVEMQNETRDLADQMSGAGSTEDAQELQAQMVDRQVEVIERHGWTRDEYNAVVDTVNEDPDLRAQFIENVVNSDTAVAQTGSEDPAAPEEDTDW